MLEAEISYYAISQFQLRMCETLMIGKFQHGILNQYLTQKNNEKSTQKGHNSYIKYEEFCDAPFNKKVLRNKMRGIKSKNHNFITYESNKTFTSSFDDKRFILDDGINTLLYGHKDIPK